MLDHISFGVSDHARSRSFYDEALAPLGVRLLFEREGELAAFGEEHFPFFLLYAHREAPKAPLHLAFAAAGPEQVAAFHAAALRAGGTDNGAPGPRDYHPGYYGAFVLDPDGHNIEAVCHNAG